LGGARDKQRGGEQQEPVHCARPGLRRPAKKSAISALRLVLARTALAAVYTFFCTSAASVFGKAVWLDCGHLGTHGGSRSRIEVDSLMDSHRPPAVTGSAGAKAGRTQTKDDTAKLFLGTSRIVAIDSARMRVALKRGQGSESTFEESAIWPVL
jgi:hypothetical protein